jgi:hypothetical protein
MSNVATDPFEKMIRDAGEGWLVDWYRPREQAVPHLQAVLRRVSDAAVRRMGGDAPSLTPKSLAATYEKNPHKVRAFLQVLDSVSSPDILVMVWRILQGMNIAAIRMAYDATGQFHLYVTLSSPYDQATEEYESTDIDDAVILRHLGTMKMDGQGIFDGFYALNLGTK